MMNGFVEKIDKLKDELGELKRYPKSKLKRYGKYFKIVEDENRSFHYEEDITKIKEITSTFGYFLLMGNDSESSVEELLYYYRAKDADEKLFMAVKKLYGWKKTKNPQ